jgi:hypothetical protein
LDLAKSFCSLKSFWALGAQMPPLFPRLLGRAYMAGASWN